VKTRDKRSLSLVGLNHNIKREKSAYNTVDLTQREHIRIKKRRVTGRDVKSVRMDIKLEPQFRLGVVTVSGGGMREK